MWVNKMYVWQADGLFYIYSQYGELKGTVALPMNGQQLQNIKLLDGLTKLLAIAWGYMSPPGKPKK